MDYERKDSKAKAKSGKEPQKLDYSMTGGKPSKLQANEDKRMKRKAALLSHFNKFAKDIA